MFRPPAGTLLSARRLHYPVTAENAANRVETRRAVIVSHLIQPINGLHLCHNDYTYIAINVAWTTFLFLQTNTIS